MIGLQKHITIEGMNGLDTKINIIHLGNGDIGNGQYVGYVLRRRAPDLEWYWQHNTEPTGAVDAEARARLWHRQNRTQFLTDDQRDVTLAEARP